MEAVFVKIVEDLGPIGMVALIFLAAGFMLAQSKSFMRWILVVIGRVPAESNQGIGRDEYSAAKEENAKSHQQMEQKIDRLTAEVGDLKIEVVELRTLVKTLVDRLDRK